VTAHAATRLTAADILAHPRFASARAAHLDAVVALFKADRFTTRMMTDAGMILLRGFLVGFHVTFDPADRATWATPGNLRSALLARGIASSRRIDDLLARFRQASYVVSTDAPGDRRTKLLVPSERLIAHDRAHLAAYHRFLLELVPGLGYEWVLGDDTGVHRAIRRAGFRNQAQATSALRHEAMRLFLAHDAGYLAFLLVAQAQLSGQSGPTWTAMSDDLGVSRSHLRTLFTAAEAVGYVRFLAGRRRPVEILPPLWQAYDLFLAGVEADQHAIAQVAFATARDAGHRIHAISAVDVVEHPTQ
jgi:AraC-like DNA-binding protein